MVMSVILSVKRGLDRLRGVGGGGEEGRICSFKLKEFRAFAHTN